MAIKAQVANQHVGIVASYSEMRSLCFGRAGSYNTGLDDLYMLDPSNNTWTDLSAMIKGSPPKPRGGHGFTSSNNRLFVFGGTKGNDFGVCCLDASI